jgi:pimeloyl-ACP methyl ester carboxylesterase
LRILGGLLGLLLLAIGAGAAYQAIGLAGDRKEYQPPGRMVSVGAMSMHIHCTGEGTPMVLLDSGAGLFSSSWEYVQEALSVETRVCSYDRAGMGWSDLGEPPFDGVTMADQLHALLEAADEPRPFVFVGHSLGGMVGRIYFDRYGDDMIGWVGIEPGEPEILFENFTKGREEPATPCDWTCSVFPAMAHIGVNRLAIGSVDLLNDPLYPERGAGEVRAYYATAKAVRSALWVGRYFRHTTWQTHDNQSFGEIPTLVIHGTRTGEALGGFETEEERVEILERLEVMWERTADSSTRSLGLAEIEGANHISIVAHRQYADKVAAEIMRVVEASAETIGDVHRGDSGSPPGET